jgi:Tol biopolymer transport system component
MIFLRNTNRQIVRSAYRMSIIRPGRELYFIAEVLFSVVIIAISAHARDPEDMIVFVSELTDELFLTDGLQGKPVQLTENMNVSWPSLSPDGEEVVFVSKVGNIGSSILRMDISTRRIDHLVGAKQDVGYSELDWSPNGRKIVFVMRIREKLQVPFPETNICVMDLQAREVHQLTDSYTVKRCPNWSPDSNEILYVETDSKSHGNDLVIIDAFGHSIGKIETPDVLEWLSAWQPNGNQILCLAQLRSSQDDKSGQQLYVMDMQERAVFDLTPSGDSKYPSDWSPDGERILFSMQGEIYVMELDSRNMANLTNTPEELEWAGGWSPDGQSIVFSGPKANGRTAIFVMDSDGQNRRQLTFGDSRDRSPAWSPDGSKITFLSDRNGADGAYRIYTMTPDGKNVQQLTNHQRELDQSFAWSPDGQSIAFVSGRANNLGVYLIDAQGRNERLIILSDTVYPDGLAWSPDGRYLVYVVYRELLPLTLFELIPIPTNGDAPTEISSDELAMWRCPVWSPDGRYLLFSAVGAGELQNPDVPSDFHIMVMNTDGAKLRRFQPAIQFRYTGGWAWSPDRSHVLLSKGTFADIITPNDSRSIHMIDLTMGTMTLWMADAAYPDWVRPGYLYSVNPVSKLLTTWGRVKNVSTSVK